MSGNNVTPGSDGARGECYDPPECTHFTHQGSSYEIRAAISTIEDRAVFLNTIRTIGETYDTHIICFNADMLAGMRHAHTAMCHALRSNNLDLMISKTLEMEALLYASGSRQCSLAAHFGVHLGKNHLYVCCYPKSDGVWNALTPVVHIIEDTWSCINSQKQASLVKLFDITGDELSTIQGDRFIDLVLERIALLEVYR
jgi:KEOPS complex subunit Cgi121